MLSVNIAELRQNCLPQHYVHIWVNVGDCGPDQRGTRSFLSTVLSGAGYERQLCFMNSCAKHQYHLGTKSSLYLLDQCLKKLKEPFKYFTTLATLTHCWRGHLSKLRKTAKLHGVQNAKVLFKLPPLAIAGRWASIDSASNWSQSRYVNWLCY